MKALVRLVEKLERLNIEWQKIDQYHVYAYTKTREHGLMVEKATRESGAHLVDLSYAEVLGVWVSIYNHE